MRNRAETANLVLKSALDRVLNHARQLADIDEDEDGEVSAWKSSYHMLQQVAQHLSGLTAAIRDYDKLMKVIEEQQQEEEDDDV
jgi:hypothetical protein